MSQPLFGVDIAGIIDAAISPGLLAATLTKVTAGTRTPGQLTGGTNPTTVNYSCRGMIDSKNRRNRDGELIRDGMERILLIGNSISGGAVAPEIGDRVTIEGRSFRVEVLDRDPAGATFTMECRVL